MSVEVPGMRDGDFEVVFDDGMLFIEGQRADVPNPRAYHQMEIHFGKFLTRRGIAGSNRSGPFRGGIQGRVPDRSDAEGETSGREDRGMMPASRWQTSMAELFEWMGQADEELRLLVPPVIPAVAKKDELNRRIRRTQPRAPKYPEVLPILPLRGVVVYPQTAVPLTVGQSRSIRLVDDVVAADKLVGLVTSTNPELESPGPKDLYQVGVIATVHRLLRAPDGTVRLLVQGLDRFRSWNMFRKSRTSRRKSNSHPEKVEEGLEVDALARNARDQFQQITQMIPSFPEELVNSITSLENPLQTVYTIANFQRIDLKDAQELLEIDSAQEKLRKLIGLLVREAEVLTLGQKIQNEARGEIEKVQREYYLREQMKAIQKELGEKDEQAAEIEELRKKIDDAKMSEEGDKQARQELDRLSRLPTAAAEYGVIRTYLDWLVALPWSKLTEDNLDIAHARTILNADHYGLEDVKDRILEFLAVRKLRLDRKDEVKEPSADQIRREREGVILCFIGPPGVGKTSLGQSIARAMGRKFIRASLGGVRDEAEIRGHRRTYIGALPGRILQSLRRIEVPESRLHAGRSRQAHVRFPRRSRPLRCWKCWIPSRTASSVTTTWRWLSTSRRFSSSRLPTRQRPSPVRFMTAWRSSISPDTQTTKRSQSPSST